MKHFEENRMPFAGRKVLVTGGSRGIAAAISRALAKQGAVVAVNFSAAADASAGKSEAAQQLVNEINDNGGKAVAVEQDLMLEGGGQALVRNAVDQIGKLDSVVLSASVQKHIPFLFQKPEDIAAQFRINLQANIEILQEVLPMMASCRFGRVLTIGSIQEVAPSPEMPIYAMTKSALRNLVESLAVQSAHLGITINNLSPGLIQTDRNEHRRQDEEAWARLTSSANPMGRAGRPEDLVASALHLLSEPASFITGATLYATGGAHITLPSSDGKMPRLKLEAAE